jgi:hypothetical protein
VLSYQILSTLFPNTWNQYSLIQNSIYSSHSKFNLQLICYIHFTQHVEVSTNCPLKHLTMFTAPLRIWHHLLVEWGMHTSHIQMVWQNNVSNIRKLPCICVHLKYNKHLQLTHVQHIMFFVIQTSVPTKWNDVLSAHKLLTLHKMNCSGSQCHINQ